MTPALIPFQHSDFNQCFDYPLKYDEEGEKMRRRASDLFWNENNYLEAAKVRFKILNLKPCFMFDLLFLKDTICSYARKAKTGSKDFSYKEIRIVIQACKELLDDDILKNDSSTEHVLKHLELKTQHISELNKEMHFKTMLLLKSKFDQKSTLASDLNHDTIHAIAMECCSIMNEIYKTPVDISNLHY